MRSRSVSTPECAVATMATSATLCRSPRSTRYSMTCGLGADFEAKSTWHRVALALDVLAQVVRALDQQSRSTACSSKTGTNCFSLPLETFAPKV